MFDFKSHLSDLSYYAVKILIINYFAEIKKNKQMFSIFNVKT